MSDEKKGVCRVCLSTSNGKDYVSLYEKHKDYFIFDHINSLANVQIKENDGFPNKICRLCLTELETAIDFRQKCEGSNLILQNGLLTQTPNSIEIFIKKEEPQDGEPPAEEPQECDPAAYLEEDHFFDNSEYNAEDKDFSSSTEFTKNILNKVELGLRKSRSIDLQLQCHDCGSFFKSKCKLRVHWKQVHATANLVCGDCKRRFKSLKAFLRHQKERTKNCLVAKNFRIEGEGRARMFYCKECEYKSIRIKDIATHWVIHTGDRPFKCDLCPKTCTQLSSLTAHKETAHAEYKLEIACHYCGKLIRGRNLIYRHLRTHTDKGIECQVCHKILKNRSCLANHMQRHSGHKSYTCEKCAHSFYTMSELSNHKRMVHHKATNWYKCEQCEYKSLRKCNIKRHTAKHTDTNVACTVCGTFVANTQTLILHQRRHFEEKKNECPFCDKKFYKRDTIRKHVRTKHSDILNANLRTVGFTVKEENLDNKLNKIEKAIDMFVTTENRCKSVSPIHINDEDNLN
ncbi:zinc finger protein 501-like [Pectinophora gossypiella]|uniref:Protein krueppel n=1 Tax=Pectinophora gossypiella TaxID=13191 RepID=A0A1E1WHL7_PECGO|nr:zinc finger protein 501-like [Pectinophora gossypiella]